MFTKWVKILSLLVFVLVLTACNSSDIVSQSEATSEMRLLDVTTSAGQSGKYQTSRIGQSFWLKDNQIYRCFHEHVDAWSDDDFDTLGAQDCEIFPRPEFLNPQAVLLGINMGTYQVTQSIWDNGEGSLVVCEHTDEFWGGSIDSAKSCKPFQRPIQVDPRSRLASLNSGEYIEAESFWVNPDGTVTQCQHEKQESGFWGLGVQSFGEVRSCSNMNTPMYLPLGNNFTLVGATSDQYRPAESYWQDADGVLVQCKHQKVADDGFFTYYHFGEAVSCQYWRAPQWTN